MYDYRQQIEQPYYPYSRIQQQQDERFFFPFFFPFFLGAAFGPWGWGWGRPWWGRPWFGRPWGWGWGRPWWGRPW